MNDNNYRNNIIYGKPISKAEMDTIYEGIKVLNTYLDSKGFFERFLKENKEAYYSE